MTIIDDLKQVAALFGVNWSNSPVIEDKQLDARETLEKACVATVASTAPSSPSS